ncbi:MAG: hypothetical protein ACW987_18730 [Candidatus Thorarchaeota archaeon]|jgi:hypothetical protein
MTGWKTWAGGLSLICTGLGVCLSAISFDPFTVDGEKVTAGVGMIGAGLTAIGIGHKVEKAGNEGNK